MMVQYLLDTDEEVRIPDIKSQQTTLRRRRRPGEDGARAGEAGQRARSTTSSSSPATTGDYRAEQFLQWFVKEQVEEVSLDERPAQRRSSGSKDNPLLAEEYLAREQIGDEGGDPTAPPAAGGAS